MAAAVNSAKSMVRFISLGNDACTLMSSFSGMAQLITSTMLHVFSEVCMSLKKWLGQNATCPTACYGHVIPLVDQYICKLLW